MTPLKKAALAAALLPALLTSLWLAGCKHHEPEPAPLAHAIYPDPGQARADLASALRTAAATHKRVLIDFGGNWCGDCKALDIYFHDPASAQLLKDNYVLVDVNIGHMDANLDLATQYGVPLNKGVPALAVLDEHGQLVYSQRSGEFEDMRHMDPSSVKDFLAEWKPATTPCSTTTVTC